MFGEGGGISTIMTEGHAPTHKETGHLALKAGVDVGISIEDAYLGDLIENVKEGKVNTLKSGGSARAKDITY